MPEGSRGGDSAQDALFARLRRLGELHARVRRAGQPSLAVLARAAGGRAKTTVGEWLKGNRLPQHLEDLLGVVDALRAAALRHPEGIDDADRELFDDDTWRALHTAVAQGRARLTGETVRAAGLGRARDRLEERQSYADLPDRPRPVARWDPRGLGVHPAISGAHGSDHGAAFVLPTYLPREHDRRLRTLLDRTVHDGDTLFVLVQGESCTGKTRAAYEAVRACLPDWDLAFPKGSESLLALLAADAVGPRTVLWLDEGQDFLTAERGEEAAAGLRRLLELPGPVVVLTTMWQEHRRTLLARPTAPVRDPHPQARALLTAGVTVHVSAAFPPDVMRDLRRTPDPSLYTAALTSRDGELTQTLAAALELVAFHETSDTVPACYGKAVVTAAMDARRLGHGPELPDTLLRAAARAYLSEAQRAAAAPGWFEQALAHAGTRVKGVVAPLGDVPDPGGMGARPRTRRLADYLDHHGRTARSYLCPAAPFWEAAAQGAGTAADLDALADAADRRGRYEVADDLRRRAAERGHAPAWTDMAQFRRDRGCRPEAVALVRKAHAAGDTGALTTLAHWYLEDQELDRALRLVPEIEGTDAPQNLLHLAQTPELAGGDEEVERLARKAADLGDAEALTFLGRRRLLAGDEKAAERLFQRAIAAGDHGAAFELARMRLVHGRDVAAAAAAAGQAAELGDFFTMGMMAQLVIAIDPAEGRRMARLAADLGGVSPADTVRLSAWENMVRQQGLAVLAQHAEETAGEGAGEAVLLAAVEEGDLHVMAWLAQRRRQSGDRADAERLYRRAAEGGYAPALLSLASSRREAGDAEEAEQLCRTAIDAGQYEAIGALAQVYEERGERERAGRLVLYGLDPDGTLAAPWLPLREGHEPARGHDAVGGWITIRHAAD
ncbi:hypothetical protein ACF073_06410 [Streptomyces sp. NPDC015171]|uniref:hypothetical protein n=1 Tax=Streptomyces sp. NPDC015171 TaxID=3364945 RepID=UPI003702F2EC